MSDDFVRTGTRVHSLQFPYVLTHMAGSAKVNKPGLLLLNTFERDAGGGTGVQVVPVEQVYIYTPPFTDDFSTRRERHAGLRIAYENHSDFSIRSD